MLRLMSLIAIAFIVEIIFFGPLGLSIYDVSVRKGLIVALVLCSIVPTLSSKPIAVWQVLFFSGAVLFLAIWGGVVPLINGVPIGMAAAEVQPMLGLFLILPFYHLFRQDGAEFYLKIARRCVLVLALIVIFVWVCSNIFHRVDVGLALRDFYISLNDSDIGVYIGPMSDGSFRVMLINFILFPIMLCYYNWKKTSLSWSAFYLLAIFSTGTRAFLLVGVLVIAVSILRRRPMLVFPIIGAVVAVSVIYMGTIDRLRIFDINSDLASSSARYLQFFSLINLFWQYPIFGAGFGAHAAVIRSIDTPYSYELTYVALLAKLGLLGSGILLAVIATWTGRLMSKNQNWTSIASLLIAIFLMTSTNPYLVNSVGISLVAFLVALGVQDARLMVNKDRLFRSRFAG